MNYELFKYRQIFDQAIQLDHDKATNIEELHSGIKQEADRILLALQSNTAHMEPAKIQPYIHQHQQAIHILLDELHKRPAESISKNNTKKIIETFRAASEDLLLNLQLYFPAYFNYQSKLPLTVLKRIKEDINKKTGQIIKILKSRQGQKQPINDLEDSLNTILTDHKHISYEQKAYLASFLERLTDKLEEAENGIEIFDIILTIISLNYNHRLFYGFCCHYFTKETDRCEELSAQFTTLNFIKKSIKQISFYNCEKYNPELPSIQDSLLNYICSELEYLESMDKIGAHLHRHGLLDEKYKVTLTVKQLAIFIHLQVEAKIIIAETPKLLHEYIAKHYSTNETDSISTKSFKNAYYSASTDDLEKVIDKIVTMPAIAQDKL